MQGFDQKFEARHRLFESDAIRDPYVLVNADTDAGPLPQHAFKTTDQIVHERMAQRPFVHYTRFDVASFSDYGRPKCEKHEDFRNPDGRLNKASLENHRKWQRRKCMLKRMPARLLPVVGPVVRNYRW